jgi:hypothetical protein
MKRRLNTHWAQHGSIMVAARAKGREASGVWYLSAQPFCDDIHHLISRHSFLARQNKNLVTAASDAEANTRPPIRVSNEDWMMQVLAASNLKEQALLNSSKELYSRRSPGP